MRHLACACSLLLVLVSAGLIQAGDAIWTQTGHPTTGYTVETLLFLPDGRLLAGNSASGSSTPAIYASADSGGSWTPDTTGLWAGVNIDVFDLVLAPETGAALAATTDGVFETALGGKGLRPQDTWVRFAPGILDPATVNALIVPEAPAGTDLVLAGTNDGVYRSSLSTPGWTASSGGMPLSTKIHEFAQLGGLLVAATNGGVYVSSDGGLNWENRSNGLAVLAVNAVAVDTTADPPALLAGTGNGVYRSRDEGLNWVKLTVHAGLPGNLETHAILADPSYPGGLFAGIVNFSGGKGVYGSPDGGDAWQGMGGGLAGFGLFVVKALAKPGADSRFLFAGTGSGVWVTKLPTATSVDPAFGFPGSTATIHGSLFGTTQGTSNVLISPGVLGAVTSWSDTAVTFTVPPGTANGRAAVSRAGGMSNGMPFARPELVLEDLTSGSRTITNEVEVRALHPVAGFVDSIRVLDLLDAASWSLGTLDTLVAAADSSRLTFQLPPSGADTVRAVMEFLVTGSPAFRDTAQIYLDAVLPVPVDASLRDLSTASATFTDSVSVMFRHVATGADSLALLSGSDVASWPRGIFDVYLPYADSTVIELTAGDGEKHVSLAFRDRAGNTVVVAPSITLDTTAPQVVALEIEDLETGSATVTDSTVVRVVHQASGAAFVKLSGAHIASWDAGLAGTFVPYVPESQVTLVPGEGFRLVTAAFADSAGNETADSLIAIEVDLTPPAGPDSVFLADLDTGDRALSDSAAVRLRIFGGSADSLRVLGGGDVASWSVGVVGSWVGAPAESSTLEFTPGDGLRRVSLEFKDRAGHVVADSAGITVDAADPVPMSLAARDLSSGNTGFTDSLSIRLVHRVEGADSIRLNISSDDSLWSLGDPGTWTAMADSSELLLTLGDGEKHVSLSFRDAAGNEVSGSVSIVLDTAAPEFVLSFHQNPILSAQLLLYAAPSESLGEAPALAFEGASLEASALPGVSPPLYQAHASVAEPGLFSFTAAGEDPAGNHGAGELVLGVSRAAPGGETVLEAPGGEARLILGAGALREEMVLVACAHEAAPAGAAQIRYTFSPQALALREAAEVRLRVPARALGELQTSGLSIFRERSGGWEELSTWFTGTGAETWLIARVTELGDFRLGPGSRGPTPLMPPEFRLAGAHPNPFNPRTTIAFDLPEAGAATLEVYDVEGRLRARLMDAQELAPGRYEVPFRGLDDEGRPIASGVYFARLSWRGRTAVEKMILAR